MIVFIGEKIEVKYAPEAKKELPVQIIGKDTLRPIQISFDSRYAAKYKVLKLMHGSYKHDTISFVALDHYGEPAFSKFQTVLLFVSYHNGKLFHEKYQYVDLYKAKNGRWASSYKALDYAHDNNKNTTVKPEKISFLSEVSYPTIKRTPKEIDLLFPAPYYNIENDRAIAVWGNYVEELFELRKSGILKARGFLR